ncbi:MAG: SH3 domain-containing protein [Muribaculaceae bacterium]|nr:SH3 domain-containing protein [Muribaculaceae bacterium]MDE5957451.1 SH3 domain-containing protein [Muribaculaceae bacterium]MDE7343913.1 SH3 domain-containing protein [Muribaculaceae bacterium]
MKISRLFISATLMLTAFAVANASDYVYITKDNVNLRESPSTSAKVIGKARLGMVVKPLSQDGTWTKATSLDGTTLYVSSQFVKPLPEEELSTDYFLFTPEQKEDALYNLGFGATTTTAKSEVSVTWILTSPPDNENVCGEYKYSYADTSGRMNTVERYYTGKRRGWYVELTHETDYEYQNPEALDTPIFVYQPYSPVSAIYVNGEYFENFENAWD